MFSSCDVSMYFIIARTLIGGKFPELLDVIDRMGDCQDREELADMLRMVCNATGSACWLDGDQENLPCPNGIRRLLARTARVVAPFDYALFLVHCVPRAEWDMRISPELEELVLQGD